MPPDAGLPWRVVLLSLFTTCLFFVPLALRAQESRPVSGFLGDYSGLAPDPKNGDLLVYEKQPDVLKKYNKFIFDPITIYLPPRPRTVALIPTT